MSSHPLHEDPKSEQDHSEPRGTRRTCQATHSLASRATSSPIGLGDPSRLDARGRVQRPVCGDPARSGSCGRLGGIRPTRAAVVTGPREAAGGYCQAMDQDPPMSDLAAKLRPDRFSEMSDVMAGIVGYIVGEDFTEPSITDLLVTADGFVLAGRTRHLRSWPQAVVRHRPGTPPGARQDADDRVRDRRRPDRGAARPGRPAQGRPEA